MGKKIALITGANSGIGKATAVSLAKKGMFVVMLCRDRQRGEAAMAEIMGQSDSRDVALMLCDLSDLADIQRFCRDFAAAYPALDVLVNNAGVLSFARRETRDGLELHFGVCHVGHFLLTLSLLKLMGPLSRIVVVGSVAHRAGGIDFEDIGMKKGYWVGRAYGRAKLCNLLFVKELARRTAGTGIAVNCVHPGAVVTNIAARRGNGKTGISRARKAAGRLLGFALQTPEKGADAIVHIATSDACKNISGAFFSKTRIAKPSKQAEDAHLAQRLWEVTDALTKAYR